VAEVIVANVRHSTCVKAAYATSAQTCNATATKATDMTSAKATDVAAAKAAHVAAAAKSATRSATMSSSSSATTAGLRTGGKKAAGKHRACQNHHHSSSHDILLWNGRRLPPHGPCQTSARLEETCVNVAMDGRWDCSPVVSIKFSFNHPGPKIWLAHWLS
jgi:hypothetical protein